MKLRPRSLKAVLVVSLLTGAAIGPVTTSPATAAPPTRHGCEYYQFCTYKNRNFTGMVDRMSSCVLHRSHGIFRSYVNNQTQGTRAKFYNYYVQFLSNTFPAYHEGTTSLGGNDADEGTWFIRPC
jgi:hypothetical protein